MNRSKVFKSQIQNTRKIAKIVWLISYFLPLLALGGIYYDRTVDFQLSFKAARVDFVYCGLALLQIVWLFYTDKKLSTPDENNFIVGTHNPLGRAKEKEWESLNDAEKIIVSFIQNNATTRGLIIPLACAAISFNGLPTLMQNGNLCPFLILLTLSFYLLTYHFKPNVDQVINDLERDKRFLKYKSV